jgi:hypothetical protein
MIFLLIATEQNFAPGPNPDTVGPVSEIASLEIVDPVKNLRLYHQKIQREQILGVC